MIELYPDVSFYYERALPGRKFLLMMSTTQRYVFLNDRALARSKFLLITREIYWECSSKQNGIKDVWFIILAFPILVRHLFQYGGKKGRTHHLGY